MRSQQGFTLLELMVAMAIFAMLAVAGWQVFDSVNRARERAQFHADNLAVLQYAYLQLQQDMGQVVAYQAPDAQNAAINSSGPNSNNTPNDNTQETPTDPNPFMSLDGEQVSFVRFADPDPRYQSSSSLQRVEYIFADGRLIRRQYLSLTAGGDSISLDSVLLEGVSAGRWQAYLPEISPQFPNESNANNNELNSTSGQTGIVLLPKGIAVDFTYQDIPITWQWSLGPQALPRSNKKVAESSDGNEDGSNGNNTEDGSSGDNSSIDTVDSL